MPLPPPSLKGRALRLLSGREYSRAELERKLKHHEAPPGELARALDELQAKGFIDERRVLESLVHRRAAKLGAARIQQELQSKGLDADAVKEAVAALRETETERARAAWRKKFGPSPPAADALQATSAAERGRQIRFLAARGFSTDTIRRVVSGGPKDPEDEPD